MANIAIIFAGGVGQRLNNKDNIPKQFLNINDKPIIIHTLELFEKHDEIDKIYISIHKDYQEYMNALVKHFYITKVAGIVAGGATSQDSIYNALKLARAENDGESIVLIHDGVRPNVAPEIISKNIKCAKEKGNAITTTSCQETVLVSKDGITPQHVPYRKETYAAQAPQTFKLKEILNAHDKMREINPNYTDIVDACTLYKTLNLPVYMIEGNRGNIKITTIEDIYILRALIRYKEDMVILGLID